MNHTTKVDMTLATVDIDVYHGRFPIISHCFVQ